MMIVKATFQNTEAEYYKFARYHAFKGHFKQLIISEAILVFSMIISFFFNPVFMVMSLLMIIALPFIVILIQILAFKKNLKRDSRYLLTTTEFEFDLESVKVLSKCKKEVSEAVINYKDLYRIGVFGNTFYLYLTSDVALIIPFNSITFGNIEDLKKILITK